MANEYAVNAVDLTAVADAIRAKGGTEGALAFPAGFVEVIQSISGGMPLHMIAISGADNLPDTANENTIAVITEKTLGNLYVQSSVPEDANNGDVYIQTARPEKQVNLAESGSLECGLAGAYIKTDGAWSFVDTYVFSGGAWVFLWSDQLYFAGSEYDAYTGGWISRAAKGSSAYTTTSRAPEITRGETSITAESAQGYGGMIYTANAIDLSNYQKVVFEGRFQRGGSYANNLRASVWSKLGTYYNDNSLAYRSAEHTDEFYMIELDVSDISEAGYIGIGLTASKAEITACYLVPNEFE